MMLGNWLKTSLLMAAIMALFGVVGGYIGGASGMIMAPLFGGAMNLFAYWFSDSMVLKMYNAREVDETSAPQFYAMVRELAQRAGLPMPRVYLIDEAQPNAFATGRNPEHAAVAATTGILRMLSARGCKVTVVPAQTSAADVLKYQPDGVFLSNGPGDPEPCDYAITAIRELLAAGVPTYGICLGHQLLALASGAKTLKMKFGHHGANHPVKDLDTQQVLITSQNHGFAVDPETLPANLRPTHVSLFDGTLQGVARTDVPAFSFQGHPEASPGPRDVAYLFDRFIKLMQDKQAAGK